MVSVVMLVFCQCFEVISLVQEVFPKEVMQS